MQSGLHCHLRFPSMQMVALEPSQTWISLLGRLRQYLLTLKSPELVTHLQVGIQPPITLVLLMEILAQLPLIPTWFYTQSGRLKRQRFRPLALLLETVKQLFQLLHHC